MQYYLDITLLPNEEVGQNFLLEKVFAQLHLALVEKQNAFAQSDIGMMFPQYNMQRNLLGRKIRLFASSEQKLIGLNLAQWLSNLADYVHTTSVRETPNEVKKWVRCSRQQFKSSPERLARRDTKRHGINWKAALEKRQQQTPQYSDAPFIWMTSLSSQKRFKLFIQQKTVSPKGGDCQFTLYGLAKQGENGVLPYF